MIILLLLLIISGVLDSGATTCLTPLVWSFSAVAIIFANYGDPWHCRQHWQSNPCFLFHILCFFKENPCQRGEFPGFLLNIKFSRVSLDNEFPEFPGFPGFLLKMSFQSFQFFLKSPLVKLQSNPVIDSLAGGWRRESLSSLSLLLSLSLLW